MNRGPSSVDVVVAVHRMDRPVGRAVSSVLHDAPPDTRVIVVCHGLEAGAVAQAIPAECLPGVDLVEHHDGIPNRTNDSWYTELEPARIRPRNVEGGAGETVRQKLL